MNAPMFENIQQYEASQKNSQIFAIGESEKVKQREEEKERKRIEMEKMLEEKNKQRFAKYERKFEVRFVYNIFFELIFIKLVKKKYICKATTQAFRWPTNSVIRVGHYIIRTDLPTLPIWRLAFYD